MTFTKYIILVWCSNRWSLASEENGGPRPGPYDTRSEAVAAVEQHAVREWRAMLNGRHNPLAEATQEEAEQASCHEEYVKLSHYVLEVRGWPDALPFDPFHAAFMIDRDKEHHR